MQYQYTISFPIQERTVSWIYKSRDLCNKQFMTVVKIFKGLYLSPAGGDSVKSSGGMFTEPP